LANLVAGEELVREYVQGSANPDVVSRYIVGLLQSPQRLSEMKQKLRIASERLGTKDASTEAADEIVNLVENTRT
jgi:lipid A disaccharide synthetase